MTQYLSPDLKNLDLEKFMREALAEADAAGQAGEFPIGAGDYELDFSGELKNNGTVNIEAGAGDVQLIIPKGVNAKVTVESAFASVNLSSNWSQDGNDYSQSGEGPTLTIIVKMAAGNLTITD